MDLDTEKKEGKLLAAIIDVLEDIALELADIEDADYSPSSSSSSRLFRSNSSFSPQLGQTTSPSSRTDSSK